MNGSKRIDIIVPFDGISDEDRRIVDSFNELIRNADDSQYESAKAVITGVLDSGFESGLIEGKRLTNKNYKRGLVQGILIGITITGILGTTSLIMKDLSKKKKKSKGQQ